MKTKKIISAMLIFVFILTFVPFISTAAAGTEDIVVKVLVEPSVKHRRVENFSEGLAAVQSFAGSYGYMDKTGETVINSQYWVAENFKDGLATVSLMNDPDCKQFVINKKGETVIPSGKYDSISSFSEGLAIIAKDKKYGVIDKTGKIVIPLGKYSFGNNSSFREGLAVVWKDGKYGYIDKTGKLIIPYEYDFADSFSDGLVLVAKNGKQGVIDKTGKIVIPVGEYVLMNPFHEGLACVWKDGKCGYIDKNNKLVISYDYNYIVPYDYFDMGAFAKNGLAVVGSGTYGIKYGVIDKTGKVIVPFEYDRISSFDGSGVAVAYKDGKYSVINTAGKTIFTCDYAIYDFHDGLAVTLSGGIWDGENGFNWGVLEILKVGYPIGDVLYSDITAYINGNAIPTSVINGKTLVVVEDLLKYGFDVKWDGNDRTLKVEINKSKKITPLPVTKDTTHKPGTFKCKYLYTDIKTYLSGVEVESYAINGVTLIDFELLAKYGKLTWDGRYRELWLATETEKVTYSKKEAYDFYQKMMKSMADIKSIDMDISIRRNTSLTSINESVIEGNIKKVIKSNNNIEMAMDLKRMAHLKSDTMGDTFLEEAKSYYTGGIYYENYRLVGGDWSRMKKKMTVDEVMYRMGLENIEIFDFPENAIKKFTAAKMGGSDKLIKFTLDGGYVKEQISKLTESDRYYSWNDVRTGYFEIDKNNDLICEAEIDKNNILKSYRIEYEVGTIYEKEFYNKRISIIVNSYNDVKIHFPSDLDSYELVS